MKVNRLETHDRYQHLMQDQSKVIAEGAEECLKRNSMSLAIQSRAPYVYLFAHPRTHEDGVTKRLIWQARLTKPKAQTNSYLFRAKSNTDIIEVCWLIPPREMWDQYIKGNVTASDDVMWSIEQFRHNRAELEAPFPDDVSEIRFRQIMMDIGLQLEQEARMKKMYIKPGTLEPSLIVPSTM